MELFEIPMVTAGGVVTALLAEVMPGHPLESLVTYPAASDPQGYTREFLKIMREYAPTLHERIDETSFALTRPEDALQGAVTPVVREGYAKLGNGKFAVALGDVRAANDPITGLGANTASDCAEVLADLIVNAGAFDEAFCVRADASVWSVLESVVAWTNEVLRGTNAQRTKLLVACAQDPRVADAYVEMFDVPARMWNVIRDPEGVEGFLAPFSGQSSQPRA